MSDAFITNGRIIDPANNIDEIGDLFITNGKITSVGGREKRTESQPINVYDATGLIVTPGFIDMHVHLREPGFEHKETIATRHGCSCRRRVHIGCLYGKHVSYNRHA